MTEDLFRRVATYQATMSLVREMLAQGIVSREEYAEVEAVFAEKYGLSLSAIYA